MSEDIDIKLVPRDGRATGMSRTALKAARKAVLSEINEALQTVNELAQQMLPVDLGS